MPLLLPSERLLPFFVFRGLHSNAEYHFVSSQLPTGAPTGLAPFVPNLEPKSWFHAAGPWSRRTDFAKFPHLLRFGSVAELFALLKSDWSQVAKQMRRFNEETLVRSSGLWAYGLAQALR